MKIIKYKFFNPLNIIIYFIGLFLLISIFYFIYLTDKPLYITLTKLLLSIIVYSISYLIFFIIIHNFEKYINIIPLLFSIIISILIYDIINFILLVSNLSPIKLIISFIITSTIFIIIIILFKISKDYVLKIQENQEILLNNVEKLKKYTNELIYEVNKINDFEEIRDYLKQIYSEINFISPNSKEDALSLENKIFEILNNIYQKVDEYKYQNFNKLETYKSEIKKELNLLLDIVRNRKKIKY